jgi:diadenosine tetraphosphate (Ap4A) HIT family hydrolase
MSKFVNLENIRRDDQKKVMEEIASNNHCPFCSENLNKYHKNPILKEGKYWLLTDNQWPYEKVKHQLLAIHKKHIEHISEMEPEAAAELISLFKEVVTKRKIPGGGIAIRFGTNPDKGSYGSSVAHIHAHLIEQDLEALGPNETWKFKFGQPKNYKKSSAI